MIKVVVSDFWHVILFPKQQDERGGSADILEHAYLTGQEGFWKLYTLNEDLLHFYQELKQKHSLKLAIFSSGSLFTAKEVHPELSKYFDEMLSVSDIGMPKSDPVAFVTLAKKLQVDPSELLFIDDTPANVESAKEGGVETILFRGNSEFKNELKKYSSLFSS